jgi:hypothetical protein
MKLDQVLSFDRSACRSTQTIACLSNAIPEHDWEDAPHLSQPAVAIAVGIMEPAKGFRLPAWHITPITLPRDELHRAPTPRSITHRPCLLGLLPQIWGIPLRATESAFPAPE